jgi:hypothetical protein
MDKVQEKNIVSVCYTPPSKPYVLEKCPVQRSSFIHARSTDDIAMTPYLYSCETLRCRKSFFLVFLVWPPPPTHGRCRRSLLQMITLSDTHTHTHTHSVRLFCTKDRPIAATSTSQHTQFTRDRQPRGLARYLHNGRLNSVEASWNVKAHAQKPDFVFRRNGRVHLNGRGRQFSRLLAAEVCASAEVMLDTPCSEVV